MYVFEFININNQLLENYIASNNYCASIVQVYKGSIATIPPVIAVRFYSSKSP